MRTALFISACRSVAGLCRIAIRRGLPARGGGWAARRIGVARTGGFPRAARIATQIARTYLRITGTGGDPVH